MKIQVFSDLHFDAASGGWVPELAPGAEAIVVAGDVCEGLARGFAFLRTFFPGVPIVTTAGNHSFYGRVMPEEMAMGRAAARDLDIHFLENDSVVLSGVRFLGTTLWTDYRLYGEGMRWLAMQTARKEMNDHRRIKWQKEPWRRFRPIEAAGLHDEAVSFLARELGNPFEGPTVVVTHHAPLPRSIPDDCRDDLCNAAYASNLSALIGQTQPELWVHGHVHTSFDYRAGETRVVSNPHGYGRENVSGFNPNLVINLEVPL